MASSFIRDGFSGKGYVDWRFVRLEHVDAKSSSKRRKSRDVAEQVRVIYGSPSSAASKFE